MGLVRVQTPQNVPVEYEAAGIGDRILARVLDYIILGCYIFIVSMALQRALMFGAIWVFILAVGIPFLLYDVVLESILNGQTLGKRLMGIRVVKLDGSQPGVGSYIMRWILFLIEGLGTTWTVALVAVAANGRGQRLGDLAAGTAVVKLKQGQKFNQSILRTLADDYQPTFPQVAFLTDNDMAIVDEAFRKSVRFNNNRLMKHLTSRLLVVLDLKSDDPKLKGMSPREFLRIVVRDYNYYTGKL